MAAYFKLGIQGRFAVNFHADASGTGHADGASMDGTALTQTYETGDHIMTLDFLTGNLAAGSHVFGVAFGMVGGAVMIISSAYIFAKQIKSGEVPGLDVVWFNSKNASPMQSFGNNSNPFIRRETTGSYWTVSP